MSPLEISMALPLGEPLPVTLERVARELRRLERDFLELEIHIADAIAAVGSAEFLNVMDLQKMDRMRQEMAGIAEFASAISKSAPHNVLIEAERLAMGVTLSELGRRLGGGEQSESSAAAGSGFELFADIEE
jgi:hypothetical protein